MRGHGMLLAHGLGSRRLGQLPLRRRRGRCATPTLVRAAGRAEAGAVDQVLVAGDAVLRDDDDAILLGVLLGGGPGEVVTADL